MTRNHALVGALIAALLCPAASRAQDSPPPPVQAAQPAAPVAAVPMTAAQIETVLRARGYDGFEGLEPAGEGRFQLARATRFGSPVGPLQLDAATGQVQGEPPLQDDQVRALLRARGYAEVREVRRDGGAILARAVREGQEVALRIDPVSGVVRPAN